MLKTTAGLLQPRPPYCIAMIHSQALSFQIRWLDPVPEIKWIFLRIKWILLPIKLNEYIRIKLNEYIPEFLKTGLAKIRAHSTTWQLKARKSVQRPIKKSLYLTPSSELMVPRSIPMSRSLE